MEKNESAIMWNRGVKKPNFKFEKEVWEKGFGLVAGIDEVGRGAIAGPVVAAAVAFAPISNFKFPIFNIRGEEYFINDSKKLTQKQRETAYYWIKKNCLTYGIGRVSAKVIDKIGIVAATEKAMRYAILSANKKLGKNINYLLVDAFYLPYVKGIPMARKSCRKGKMSNGKVDPRSCQKAITKGDERSFSIASASIVAKVTRDRLMARLSQNPMYKMYGWNKNKGYGTKEHMKAIGEYLISIQHRKRFLGEG